MSYMNKCNSTNMCNDNAALICLNSTCVCPAKTMWDGDSCGNLLIILKIEIL